MGLTGKYLDENNNIIEVIEWCVYLLIHNHKVVYIGCSRDLEKRLKQHTYAGRIFDSYVNFHQSYNKGDCEFVERILIRYSNLYTELELTNKYVFSSWGAKIIKN